MVRTKILKESTGAKLKIICLIDDTAEPFYVLNFAVCIPFHIKAVYFHGYIINQFRFYLICAYINVIVIECNEILLS